MFDPNEITYFGETDSRGKRVRFGIKAIDRTKHMYVIGKSGMGKSTLLENLAVQDIQNGNGFCFLDPHGGSAELLMAYIPEERKEDVLYIAPFDTENPIGFNILENIGPDKRHLVVSGIMSVFKKLWADQWSARMEYFLQNTLFALLEYPGATLLHVNQMYTNKDFRDEVITHITDPAIRKFWTEEWDGMTERFIAEATPAIQNKIGQFAANPVLRNILGQPKSTFDFRQLMDERKIVIVNLSKGLIGEANADLIGSMVVTKLYLAAMSRADVGKFEIDKLPNFYLYVDEFQSFSNESFANILSEARKYKLNLTIAHQYVEQMEETVRAAVFGNVGTTITFRVGAYDGEVLEKEFAPVFTQEDIVNLGKYQIYLKLMIDGVGSIPFSSTTLPPLPKPEIDLTEEVIKLSRQRYSTSKEVVEKNMQDTVFFDSKKKKEEEAAKNKKSSPSTNDTQHDGLTPQQRAEKRRQTDQKKSGGIPQAPHQGKSNTGGGNNSHNQKNKNHNSKKQFSSGKENQPEPPPLSEMKEENPFKLALKDEGFVRSVTEKIDRERKLDRQKAQEQKNAASLKQEMKQKNQEKETNPENRNSLQEALAALKPFTKKEENQQGQEDQNQPKQNTQGSKEDNHDRKKDSHDHQKESSNQGGKDSGGNNTHAQKEEETTRQVKIPAHISDDQLQKILKITEKDLEFER